MSRQPLIRPAHTARLPNHTAPKKLVQSSHPLVRATPDIKLGVKERLLVTSPEAKESSGKLSQLGILQSEHEEGTESTLEEIKDSTEECPDSPVNTVYCSRSLAASTRAESASWTNLAATLAKRLLPTQVRTEARRCVCGWDQGAPFCHRAEAWVRRVFDSRGVAFDYGKYDKLYKV